MPMTTRKRRAIFVALALLAVAVAVGVVAILPRSNELRVHVETIQHEDGHYHCRWTFTGGHWESYGQGFNGDDHFVVLDRPGARDSASIRSIKEMLAVGASRIVYEVEARRASPAAGSGRPLVSIKRTLSGNGTGGSPGFTATLVLPLADGPWDSRFRTTQAEDATITFPTKLKLGDFGGSADVIEFR
jgi:hypothetical protein